MEHKTLHELRGVARTAPVIVRTPGIVRTMSRRARLEHWAKRLEREPQRPLAALMRVESVPREVRPLLRADNSPLDVAWRDPALREEGLASDRLGDAMRFFELSPRQAHYLVCDCYYQGSMTAGRVASRIRTIAPKMTFGEMWGNLIPTPVRRMWR